MALYHIHAPLTSFTKKFDAPVYKMLQYKELSEHVTLLYIRRIYEWSFHYHKVGDLARPIACPGFFVRRRTPAWC